MTESANFGKVIRSYQGSGNLHFENDEQRASDFEILQNLVGTIYALCELEAVPDDIFIYNIRHALRLTGTDEKKNTITISRLMRKDMKQKYSRDEVTLKYVFICKELTVESEKYQMVDYLEFRFTLTNFVLEGTESIVFQLPLETDQFRIVISHLEDYEAQIAEIQATKQPNVTCQAIVADVSAGQEQEVIDAVNDLCLLLTLARGCRIEWPHYDVLSPNGEIVKSHHRDAIIKPYSGLSLIAKNPSQDIKTFVESTFNKLQENEGRWELRRAIDAYTDAKLETDFLESRGLKTVVVIEHLKSRYLEHICDPAKTTIIDDLAFEGAIDQLMEKVEKLLQEAFQGTKQDKLTMMANHIRGLNWYPFGRSLSEICRMLGLQINSIERRKFVRMRNELVHRFSYLDNFDEYGSKWEQYRFLITFVGKILLAILEYDGYYLDWTKPIDFEANMRVKLDLELNDQQ